MQQRSKYFAWRLTLGKVAHARQQLTLIGAIKKDLLADAAVREVDAIGCTMQQQGWYFQ
jgi:hypothetical protein